MTEYKEFMDAAVEYSLLFRGVYPLRHGSLLTKDGSTFFAFSPEYEKGSVRFCGKMYTGIELNLNAFTDELYAKDPQGSPVVVNKNFVDSFSLGASSFVYFRQNDVQLSKGYYQVLYTGKHTLYKKVIKKYYQKPTNFGVLQKGFVSAEFFYIRKNDQWYRFNTRADLMRLFGEHKKRIDHLCKSEKLKFRRDREHYLVRILTYMDQL